MKNGLLVCVCFLVTATQPFVPLHRKPRRTFSLAAGPPPYEKVDAVLVEDAEKVADGTFVLHIEHAKGEDFDYQPGHVLALELEAKEDDDDVTTQDVVDNGGWMRGPYTVSRSQDSSLDIMIRVVGKKSTLFSEALAGTPVRVGGKFKVPILEGIHSDAEKVVFISTGVGIGPCIGAVELALDNTSKVQTPPISLLASFREESDVVYRDHLDQLSSQHSEQFNWTPIITSENGRLSDSKESMAPVMDSIQGYGMSNVHYHLIGNGQLVNEWKQGLKQAGVPDDFVTVEQYFNHQGKAGPDAIQTIASTIEACCKATVA